MSQHISQQLYADGVEDTTGLETVTLWSVDLSGGEGGINIDDCAFRFQAEVVLNTAAGAASTAVISRGFKRFGGTLSTLGAVITMHPLSGDLALATAGITLDANGDSIRLRATGVLLQNIKWVYYIKFRTGEFG